jgi:hypothetical protein
VKDGGNAYPFRGLADSIAAERGMTMRQRYKIAAMQSGRCPPGEQFSVWCGNVADAMIAEDERHSKGEE